MAKQANEATERREVLISWLVIAGLVLAMFAAGFGAYFIIGNRPRSWEYGARPFIPAESYSSTEPVTGAAPKQVELPPPPKGRPAK